MRSKILLIILFLLIFPTVSAETCAVYFTGIGCPHCANTDPVLLEQTEDLVIIEYEIYQQRENAELLLSYDEQYASGFGVPLLILNKDTVVIGDRPILNSLQELLDGKNSCPLLTGPTPLEALDFNSLPKSPKIWANNRILIADGKTGDPELLRDLLLSENPSALLEGYTEIQPQAVPYSGGQTEFNRAVKIDGWIFQWTEGLPFAKELPILELFYHTETAKGFSKELTFTKLISLAAVDAVNPCALAVLTLMLIAILTYNPKEKKNVLLAGLAFSSSVFIMYLVYGLVIVKSFQIIQALTSVRLLLYKILGIGAILLGILNIKDFIKYKPGSLGTEMPVKLRPYVKKIISGITSPKGAFIVGILVTIFLLPCTIGPYVIAGGILSVLEILQTLPWLTVYNFIFILPMLAITLLVYLGMARVEDVSKWKDKNIKNLHLIAGIIILLLGIAMIMGWV